MQMQSIRPALRAAFAAAVAVTMAGCAATTLTSSWKEPGAGPLNLRGQKVAAIVLAPRQGARRGGEVSLAREITARGAVGMPAYGIVPQEEIADPAKVKARLDSAGVVAAIVMRAVSKEQQVNYVPGTGYWGGPAYRGGFYGYYGYGYNAVSSPGYLTTDTIITVETLVYDLRTDTLVWAGMSQTLNPEKLDAFVTELAAVVAKELQRQGLIGQGTK